MVGMFLCSIHQVTDLIYVSTTRESSPQDAHQLVTKPMHVDRHFDAAAAVPVVSMV
jgi:hypothetical protein